MKIDIELEELNNILREYRGAREPYEPEWYLNMSFYQGEQWVFWNRRGLDKPRLEDHRELVTDNRILPAVDSRVSRKTKQRPTFVTLPYSADEKDKRRARLGENLLDQQWDALLMSQKFHSVVKMADILGAGFWKIYWDATEGEKVEYYFADQGNGLEPVLQNGKPVRKQDNPELENVEGVEVKPIAPGSIRVELVTPFGLYPDPIATSLAECERLVEENIRSIQYLEERFPSHKGKFKADAGVKGGIVESRQLFGLNRFSTTSGEPKGVKVYELWEKPCNKYPMGRRAIWTDTDVLLAEDLSDSPFSGNPYVMFSSVDVPGRFWPTSITTQLRGPQTQLNKLLSQVQENLQRIGNPTLMSSRHANIQWSGLPGEQLLYEAGMPENKPDYLHPPEMPAYLQHQIQKIEDSITEISGVHEVSKANVPSGVTAASAINLLQEADDTRLGPEIVENERALAEAGTKILKLMASFASDGRIIRIAGEEGDWNILEFRQGMVGESTDVEVQAGSTMPRSKAAKQAAMQEMFNMMMQYGVEIDQRAMRKFFRDFEVAGLETLVSGISNSELQVQREHSYMRQGIAMEINDWDDDAFHIEAHDDFRRSIIYEELHPTNKDIIDKHVAAHKERRRNAIEAEMRARRTEMQGGSNNGDQSQSQVQQNQA